MSSNGITASREVVSAPAAANTVTVSGGGVTYSGTSIVEAFDKLASVSSGDITITLAPGTYDVPFGKGLNYKGGANIKILGTGTAKYGLDVLIKGRGKNQLENKTRPVLEVEGTGNLVLENVTIRNTTKRSEVTETNDKGNKLTQAEALGFDSSGTVAAYNCSFLSHQDTVRTVSKSWFYKCYIEGDVDFIWMEAGSIVGLYEECKIYMVGDDEKSEGYVLAPRIDLKPKVGKGNVIYKSRIIVGDGVKNAYLFRNPWSDYPDTLYNQGAVVDTEISGTLHSDLAKHDAWGEDGHDPKHLGWKVDSAIAGAYSSRLSSIGTVDATTKASEYGGREAILNRMYNLSEKSYAQDNSDYWDIDAVIKDNGWNVTGDSSSSELDGDSSKTSVTYTFTDKDKSNGWTDSLVDTSNFSFDPNGYAQGNTNKTLTFWIVGDCTITVTGYYSGAATVTHGSSSASYKIATQGTSASAVLPLTGISSAGERVTITANEDKTYIKSIDIQYTANVDAALEALRKQRDEAASMTVTWDFNATPIPAQINNKTTWIKTDGTNSDAAPSASDAAIYIYGDATKEKGNSYIQTKGEVYGSAALYVPVATGSGYKVTVTYNVNDKCYLTIGGTMYDSKASTSVVINCSSATLKTNSDIPALVSGISYLPIELGSTDPSVTGTSMKGYVSKIVVSAE